MRARIALCAAALAAIACGAAPEPPNVLLVTIDTLRPDRLSAYGYARRDTPHIDAFAAEGALFEHALTDTPWTTASMSTVMTGTWPTIHGFKSTNVNRLALENVTLAELLRDAGFATEAVIGSFPLDAIYQLDQGFDRYDDAFTTPILVHPNHEKVEPLRSVFLESPEQQRMFVLSKSLNDSRREDAEVTDTAIERLRALADRPFFLWVHYFGPHDKPDWNIPEPLRDRRRLQAYDPDVAVTDREVGRLLAALDELGLSGSTLVVFHADHGESLGEQGFVGHGQLLNEATMRIPLIVRWPGVIEAGARVESLVRNVDIFPTVLEAVGVESAVAPSGRSLLPLVRSSILPTASEEPRVAYLESYYGAHTAFAMPVTLPDGSPAKVGIIRRGVRTQDWKLVRTEPYPLLDVSAGSQPEVPAALRDALRVEQLYAVSADGGDSRDVIDQHPEVAAALRAELERHLEPERGVVASQRMHVDEETKLRLEALGYGD